MRSPKTGSSSILKVLKAAKAANPRACENVSVELWHDVVRDHIRQGVTMAVLREPCERFLSVYGHLKRFRGMPQLTCDLNRELRFDSPLSWGRFMLFNPDVWRAFSEPDHPNLSPPYKPIRIARLPERSRRCYGEEAEEPPAVPHLQSPPRPNMTTKTKKDCAVHSKAIGQGQATRQSAYFLPSSSSSSSSSINIDNSLALSDSFERHTRVICLPRLQDDLRRIMNEMAAGCMSEHLLSALGATPSRSNHSIVHANVGSYNRTKSKEICAIAGKLYPEDVALWNKHCADT